AGAGGGRAGLESAHRPGCRAVGCAGLISAQREVCAGSPAAAAGSLGDVLRRRKASTPRFAYSRWDGTQVGFELGADDVFSEITDDLLYHGDLNAALRRMMQSGFQD